MAKTRGKKKKDALPQSTQNTDMKDYTFYETILPPHPLLQQLLGDDFCNSTLNHHDNNKPPDIGDNLSLSPLQQMGLKHTNLIHQSSALETIKINHTYLRRCFKPLKKIVQQSFKIKGSQFADQMIYILVANGNNRSKKFSTLIEFFIYLNQISKNKKLNSNYLSVFMQKLLIYINEQEICQKNYGVLSYLVKIYMCLQKFVQNNQSYEQLLRNLWGPCNRSDEYDETEEQIQGIVQQYQDYVKSVVIELK